MASTNYTKGVWMHVTTLSIAERWKKYTSFSEAYKHAYGFFDRPSIEGVFIYENGTETFRYVYAEREINNVGIISQAAKNTQSSFISATRLADEKIRFVITAVGEDEFRGQKQYTFDIALLQEIEGEPSTYTFKLGTTDQKGNIIESRAAIVDALKAEGALPYAGDFSPEGEALGCIIVMKGRFASLEDYVPTDTEHPF